MTARAQAAEVLNFEGRCRNMYAYLNQGKVWAPKDRPNLPVTDMDPSWRRNAARWMERRAARFGTLYTFGEIFELANPSGFVEVVGIEDGEPVLGPSLSRLDLMSDGVQEDMLLWQDEREANPLAWIRTTALYRALVADLPAGVKLGEVA